MFDIFDTMSKNTRAKFQCNSVTDFGHGDYCSQEAKLTAVMPNKDSVEENGQFNNATPNGQLTITIDNPAVQGFFKPGVQYYLDIQAAPRESQDFPESYDKLMANN